MNTQQTNMFNKVRLFAESIGWKVLSASYVDSKTKLLFSCDKEHPVEIRWNNLNSGQRCKICLTEAPKIAFMKLLDEEGYELLTEYVNVDTHVWLICPSGHLYRVRPDHFKNDGSRCTACPCKRSIKCANRFLNELETDEYVLLGKYENIYTKVLVQCPKNHLIKLTPGSFHYGHKCRKCANKDPEQAEEEFLFLASNEGYIILDDYINSTIPLEAICPKQHIIYIHPSRFKQGSGCIKCMNCCPIQAKENFINKLTAEGYLLCDIYVNTRVKTWIKCPNLHPWFIEPCEYLRGRRCIHCPRNESKGEQTVRLVLEKYSIPFIVQRKFQFLPTRKYDFYLTFNNNNYIIEFDGIQHFKYTVPFHDDMEDFNNCQYTDIVKTYVPLYYNIKVIRISYKEIKEVEYHILSALQLDISLYLSNPDLYKYILDYPH